MRAHQLGVDARRRRRRARGGRSSRAASRSPAGPRPPPASRPNASASRASGTENVCIPQPSMACGSSAGSSARRLGEPAPHRLLHRVAGVEVARDRPALRHRERDRERVLARAVVAHRLGPPAGVAIDRGRDGSRGSAGPQARSGSERPAARNSSRTRSTWSSPPPCEAQAIARWSAPRPKRSGTPARTPASAWNGLAAERTKTAGPAGPPRRGHRPGHAMLALDPRAAMHADDGLADHDARTW